MQPWSALSPRPATAPSTGCWPTCHRRERCAASPPRALELLPRIDVLLNNAGAVFLSNKRSVDDIELTFALNHMGYFLLTSLLLERLRESVPARIINVSSSSHWQPGRFKLEDLPKPGGNGGYRAYGRSKLCNILFTYELARRLEGSGIAVNALHPGLVQTNIARNNGLLGRFVNFFIGARASMQTRERKPWSISLPPHRWRKRPASSSLTAAPCRPRPSATTRSWRRASGT